MTTVDEERGIRLEVEKALYALGDTVQQVMETLRNKGIRLDRCCTATWINAETVKYEDRHAADNCPVHDYLSQEFPELTMVTVGAAVTRFVEGKRVLAGGSGRIEENFVKNPASVSMFIQMYDNHNIGMLEDA